MDLLSIPAPIFAFSILPHVTSDDLLSLRASTKRIHSFLHESDESEIIWRRMLLRDFAFADDTNGTAPASSLLPSPPAGDEKPDIVHHLKTLCVLDRSEYENILATPTDTTGRRVVSVFGYAASDGVMVAASSFISWKHWRKASSRFYKLPSLYFYKDANPRAEEGTRREIARLQKRMLNGPYFLRAASLWAKIEQWCDSSESGSFGSRLKRSLMQGIPYSCYIDGTVRYRENAGDDRGMEAFQAVYAFYGGQQKFSDETDLLEGLLGGYAAYNIAVCTRFVGVDHYEYGRMLHEEYGDYVQIAYSFRGDKIFELHKPSGVVYLRSAPGNRIPAVNMNSQPSSQKRDSEWTEEKLDIVLVWLETFADRLRSGYYEVGRLVPDIPDTETILLYPTLCAANAAVASNSVPITSRAVTRGIEVVASSVSTHEYDSIQMGHIYSIRIRLLMPHEEDYVPPSQRGFETCQLESRHWIIRNDVDGTTEHVRGEGVIGLYPLLREGGYRINKAAFGPHALGLARLGTFCYQSCSQPMQGSFRGQLRFVSGSLQSPTGEPFDVEVAPFALDKNPAFLF